VGDQRFDGRDLGGDQARDDRQRAALAVDVDAEARHARNGVARVVLLNFLQVHLVAEGSQEVAGDGLGVGRQQAVVLDGVIVPLMRNSGGDPGWKCKSLTPWATAALSSPSSVLMSQPSSRLRGLTCAILLQEAGPGTDPPPRRSPRRWLFCAPCSPYPPAAPASAPPS